MRGMQDSKERVTYKVPPLRKYPHSHPQKFFQPQGEFWAWAVKTRQFLKALPGLCEGTDIGWAGDKAD